MGKTKYPILFVHGMGFRDRKIFSYWGRIPKRLKSEGYVIYFGEQDANGTIEQNGKYIAKKIEKILENETDDKVNIIAHSKGGLDARYAICNCNVSDKVASLTTIGTPHHGSKSINILLKFPVCLIKFFCLIADIILKVLGDGKPNTYAVIKSFSTDYMTEFNKCNKNVDSVYYQSYAFIMKKYLSDILMVIPHLFVKMIEGDNDGLLTPESVKWGDFRGIYTGASNRGISHCDEVDMRRRRFTKKKSFNLYEISDITDFYVDVVNELQQKGF